MSVTPIAGGGAVSVKGANCPDIVPATAMVTSSATEGDGSALSTSMGPASGASFLVGGTSATLWRWEPGKEDEGLQDRVVISVQQNNSTVMIVRQTLTRQGQWCWLCVSAYPDVAGELEVHRQTSPRMIRRSRRLAPSPQPPGRPWLIRCPQFVLSVLWRRWAAYGKDGADRGVVGNSDTMLMNPVLRQSVSINSSDQGKKSSSRTLTAGGRFWAVNPAGTYGTASTSSRICLMRTSAASSPSSSAHIRDGSSVPKYSNPKVWHC
jgi:hypothetical protein